MRPQPCWPAWSLAWLVFSDLAPRLVGILYAIKNHKTSDPSHILAPRGDSTRPFAGGAVGTATAWCGNLQAKSTTRAFTRSAP
jgi:hypothetical protein